jgi:alcohol dehydrogenase
MRVPNSMEFECPVKIHCGDRALNHIPFELRAIGSAKPLIIGDEAATRDKRIGAVLNACRDADISLGVVEEVPWADMQDSLQQLAAIYRDKDCDALVAVGQEGFIDLAKGLNLLLSTGADTLAPFVEGQAIPRTLHPLAVIPSAKADGFELSGYLHFEGHTLRSVQLMPQLLFLDPRATGHPEDGVLVATALNALANGVEAYFGVDTNPMKAVYARPATMLASEALCILAGRGSRDADLAMAVTHAAALGGCALGIDRFTTTHCLAQAIAATGKASAVQAKGVLLSYVLEQRVLEGALNVDVFLSLAGGNDRFARTPEHQRGPAAIYFLRSLINQLFETSDGKIGRTLQDIGLTRSELSAIARSACEDGRPENPEVFETILTHAWEGRPFGCMT